MGKVPTVSIDKTDGCMVYLSKDSLDATVVTAKSSEMNILVPKDDGDFVSFSYYCNLHLICFLPMQVWSTNYTEIQFVCQALVVKKL